MKSKRSAHSKNTKFVRINNTTWIEADMLIPDEVARMQFLQKMYLVKPNSNSGHVKNDNSILRNWSDITA
jgi:hypothetical protein